MKIDANLGKGNSNISIYVALEEVVHHSDLFGTWIHFHGSGGDNGPVVFLEDCGLDESSLGTWEIHCCDYL